MHTKYASHRTKAVVAEMTYGRRWRRRRWQGNCCRCECWRWAASRGSRSCSALRVAAVSSSSRSCGACSYGAGRTDGSMYGGQRLVEHEDGWRSNSRQ